MTIATKANKRGKDVREVKVGDDTYKAEFYYLRCDQRTQNEPFITCCLLFSDSGEYSRGISICSKNDPFSKLEGRKKAKDRAIFSIKKKTNGLPILRDEAIQVIRNCMLEINRTTITFPLNKASYKPDPFWLLEDKLMKKHKVLNNEN